MRIGSNLSGIDLTAHNSLLRNLNQLSLSSVRLSTMQRINKGSDDPAGLIAVGTLQSELAAIQEASNNTSRAVGTIRVADSGMSQVTGLLNDIRGHMVAAAGGGLSDAEIAAKQTEIDAALEAVNRIGNVTSFGGRKLLDGQAGYETSGVNSDQIANIEVAHSAGDQRTVDVEVTQAATAASLTFTSETGALAEDVTLLLSGDEGTVTLDFAAGTSLEQIAVAVEASTENTGVTAEVDGTEVTFSSTEVGSDATVAIEAIAGTFDVGGAPASGTDVVVNVDGVEFTGSGNEVQISTETLQADLELAAGFTGEVDPITISGDALTFVFSPDVTQTSTLTLPTINTAALGGAAGRLADLATGGSASLASGNFAEAIDVLDAARDDVLQSRARAGAFEKYTVESSRSLLDEMEVAISTAVSMILDTDVATETSRLIQSQILVDSALNSLKIAGRSRSLIGGLFDAF